MLDREAEFAMTGMIAAVVVAAGRGHRAGGEVPKQYRAIAGQPVIRPTLAGLLAHPQIAAVQPVIHSDDDNLFRTATAGLKPLAPVRSGWRCHPCSPPAPAGRTVRG